jgi:hypothetical protein
MMATKTTMISCMMSRVRAKYDVDLVDVAGSFGRFLR